LNNFLQVRQAPQRDRGTDSHPSFGELASIIFKAMRIYKVISEIIVDVEAETQLQAENIFNEMKWHLIDKNNKEVEMEFLKIETIYFKDIK
jgi:hypothetical protein